MGYFSSLRLRTNSKDKNMKSNSEIFGFLRKTKHKVDLERFYIFCCCFYLLKIDFFSHTVYPNEFLLPELFQTPPTYSSLYISFPSFSHSKRAVFREKTTKHDKTEYNKTGQKSSHWSWTETHHEEKSTSAGKSQKFSSSHS